MQSCNRFLNEYENYCIINCLLELNSPVMPECKLAIQVFKWKS
jgi:hypothetical protein